VFLNQRAAEFSFFTPSAPPLRPIHSNLSGLTNSRSGSIVAISSVLKSYNVCQGAFNAIRCLELHSSFDRRAVFSCLYPRLLILSLLGPSC
jgi:hypothetical protein